MSRPLIRRFFAGAVACALLASQGSAAGLLSSRNTVALSHLPPRAVLTPPKPVPVKEPPRKKPSHPPLSAIKPAIAKFAKPLPGAKVAGPPMLTGNQLVPAIIAAHKFAGRVVQAVRVSRPGGRVSLPSRGRTVRSINGQPGPGTGVVPWWRYTVEAVPSADVAGVNVGTGNLVLRYSDMSVPHKGVPMQFTRIYNSQQPATVTGSTTTWQSMYGTGWTNTFDAHLVATGSQWVSVYDVDGARYDYVQDLPPNGPWLSTSPGTPGSLAYDGGCGMVWTKRDGTTYDFYNVISGSPCFTPQAFAQYGGLAGRLHQIIGRNSNTTLTFGYTWDNGNASPTGKINQITVAAESGMTSTLSFADVYGHRLLQQLTFPDGVTKVTYGYDANGNLTSVTRPANNYAGTNPQLWYGYNTVGSDYLLEWATNPRWAVQCNQDNCGGDGAYIAFAYNGNSAPTSTVSSVQSFAVVNPSVNDGYAAYGALQGSSFPNYAYAFKTEYYTTGVSTPTFRDTDGHFVNWVVDGTNRVTQTQVCTVTPASGSACPAANTLVTNESWDAANNHTQIVDPRGGMTDMAYYGPELVAVALPAQYPNQARPTTLFDYDGYGNVTAVCDPALVHSGGKDWNGQYGPTSTTFCASQFSSGYASRTYTHPSYEPYGELTTATTAGGYARQISYDTAPQGGTDYGLPTKAVGTTSIAQFDGTSRIPTVSASYDANGNVVCTQTDAGTGTPSTPAVVVNTYDALGRVTASGDADDASLAGACTGKMAGIAGSTIVDRTTYYADGSVATMQTPSEAALGYGTVYTYDLDGNTVAEAPYTASPQSPQTAVMKRWFDGMDRTVETQEPPDPNTSGDLPISIRYFYDLSQNGTAATLNGSVVSAHGNLFDTVKNTPSGWIDFTYSAFDANDRKTMDYAFAPCPAQGNQTAGPVYCSQAAYATRYDYDSSTLNPNFAGPGTLVATLDGAGVTRMFGYNADGALDTVLYSGDGGVTPHSSYMYDFDGRLSDVWNTFTAASAPAENHVAFTYTADGNISQQTNTSLNTAVGYAYYPDAALAGVSATTTQTVNGNTSYVVNQPNLYQYAYRNDGLTSNERYGAAAQPISWSYTRGGRMTTQTDFSGNTSLSAQYADGYGRLSSYTTPSGTYGSIQYDRRGNMIRYTDPQTSVDGETVTSTYNIRGDLIGRAISGGTAGSKPGFQFANIQGVLVQNPGVDQFDGRTGAMLVVRGSGYYTFSYDQVGRMRIGTYDGENRLVTGDTFQASSAADDDCHSGGAVASWVPPTRELSYIYDGLGQLFQDTNPPITVAGHQIPQIRQWIWDRANPLYTMAMNSSGNGSIRGLSGYDADGRGSVDPSTSTLTVADRDFDGVIAQYHNPTGHSTWTPTNPYNQFCVSANPLPASANYSGPSANPVPDDGTSDPSLVVNSYGRAYLSRSMGYTTPDYSSATPYASSRDTQSSRHTLVGYKCPALTHWDSEKGRCVDDTPFEGIDGGDPFGFAGKHLGGGGGGMVGKTPKPKCPPGTTQSEVQMTATGYENGPQSTGKKPGDPGYGVTTSGTTAKHGSIAADPANYPAMRTRMYVPGYGWGRVEDTGGDIKGSGRIDLWFPTVKDANQWGRKSVPVTVCRK